MRLTSRVPLVLMDLFKPHVVISRRSCAFRMLYISLLEPQKHRKNKQTYTNLRLLPTSGNNHPEGRVEIWKCQDRSNTSIDVKILEQPECVAALLIREYHSICRAVVVVTITSSLQ